MLGERGKGSKMEGLSACETTVARAFAGRTGRLAALPGRPISFGRPWRANQICKGFNPKGLVELPLGSRKPARVWLPCLWGINERRGQVKKTVACASARRSAHATRLPSPDCKK